MSQVWEKVLEAFKAAQLDGSEFIMVFNNAELWEPEIHAAKDVNEFWMIYEECKKNANLHLEYTFGTHQHYDEIVPASTKKEIPRRPIKRSEIKITVVSTVYENSFLFMQGENSIGQIEIAHEAIMGLLSSGYSNIGEYALQLWAKKSGAIIIEDRERYPCEPALFPFDS